MLPKTWEDKAEILDYILSSESGQVPVIATKHSTPWGTVTRFWEWVKHQIVQEVPEDIALCEYDCHKQQCTGSEFETCDRRLTRAAGEFMPDRGESGEAVICR